MSLQAPLNYGRFVFDRWIINNLPQAEKDSDISLLLSTDAQVEARYRLVAGPVVITPATIASGQIGFSILSESGWATRSNRARA